MMKTIKLNLKDRSYAVTAGNHILNFLGKLLTTLNIGTDAYIVTNPLINKHYGRVLTDILKKEGFSVSVRLVADSEKSKSLETATALLKNIAVYDKQKRPFLVAFGGGVIGDLCGFVASIYKRGIPYINIPTTFLAQIDSSIGGKTAVDLPEGKNLVGSFYQPRLVLSDAHFLKTLVPRQFRSGLAEAIKYACIKDAALFEYIETRCSRITELKDEELVHIISSCASIKARIVEQDEREERGIRTLLNFGHTVGHALETATGYTTYTHGEAIALGMIAAAHISRQMGLTNTHTVKRIEQIIGSVGLLTRIRKVPLSRIIQAHYRDKKFIGAKNRFVLIKGIGKACVVSTIPLETVKKAVAYLY